MIPAALTLAILALAAFRVWRLLSRDDLPWLVRARDRLVGAHGGVSEPIRFDRPTLAHWLQCAWCSGAAVSLLFAAAWWAEPRWTLYAALPLALSTVVALLARLDG